MRPSGIRALLGLSRRSGLAVGKTGKTGIESATRHTRSGGAVRNTGDVSATRNTGTTLAPSAAEGLPATLNWPLSRQHGLVAGQQHTLAVAPFAAQGVFPAVGVPDSAHPQPAWGIRGPLLWAEASVPTSIEARESFRTAGEWGEGQLAGIMEKGEEAAEGGADDARVLALARSAARGSVLPLEFVVSRQQDLQLLAVPKRKVSPSRKGMRNGPKALKPVPAIVQCRACGRTKLRHLFCCAEGDRLKSLHPQRHWKSLLNSAAAQQYDSTTVGVSQAEPAGAQMPASIQ